MSARRHILFLDGPTWQIASVTGGQVSFADMLPPWHGRPAHDSSEGNTRETLVSRDVSSANDMGGTPMPRITAIAERVAEELGRLGYTGLGVMLVLGSSDCLAASIDVAGLPRGDRKAMLYRLEEKLPMAAESVVADFVAAGERALGVCVREEAVLPLVNALERCGVAVQSVCPAALLAAQQLVDGESRILILGEGEQVNVIAARSGAPVSWSLLPARAADLALQLDLLSLESGEELPIRACGVDTTITGNLATSNVNHMPPRQVAAIAGAAVLDGRLKPWIELRRGALAIADPLRLHRTALDALIAGAAVLLLCLTLGLLWRAHRYDRMARAAEQKMADEFSAIFRGWPRPSNVKTVVESEHRKLGAPGSTALPAEARDSAVRTLHAVLGHLPPEVKFKIESLSFSELTFDLQGRVRNFADVDAMAASARLAGMDVPPPQAHRDADGFWNFTLHGTKPTAVAKK